MAPSAGRGLSVATNSNSNELIAQDKPQLVDPSSPVSKEGVRENDKCINNTVDLEEIAPDIAVTVLEPEEPIEDEYDDDNEAAGSSSNKSRNKKEKKKSKPNTKQAKKSKKSEQSQVRDRSNTNQQELRSNSTKCNDQHDSNKNQSSKPKSLVEDLKLFQNNHLLNQQDPMQQLHIQLNALIENDNDNHKRDYPHNKSFSPPNSQSNAISRQHLDKKFIDNENNCLSSSTIMQQQQFNNSQKVDGIRGQDNFDTGENIFTVKKGILWQQQNYDRFHQRLFSRWKKRYFILTTDYLVCFKRSSPKVGRSEMGKFLYKVSHQDFYLLLSRFCF